MKKAIIFTFTLCMFFVLNGYSETYLRDFFDVVKDESFEKEAFPIDKKLQRKYQAVAKQFYENGSVQASRSIQTNVELCRFLRPLL